MQSAKPFYATTEKKLSVPMRVFIKGFKSIAEGQYVALGKKLTFLVGPNSAGKSAIYAAISKLRQDAPLFELDVPSLHYKERKTIGRSFKLWVLSGKMRVIPLNRGQLMFFMILLMAKSEWRTGSTRG